MISLQLLVRPLEALPFCAHSLKRPSQLRLVPTVLHTQAEDRTQLPL